VTTPVIGPTESKRMSRLPTFPASYENEHSRLVEHRGGFTVRYEAGGEVVGVLSLNADDDYKLADALLRSHAPMAV
jgi:hypothetical protein